jgi:hypothetical protein
MRHGPCAEPYLARVHSRRLLSSAVGFTLAVTGLCRIRYVFHGTINALPSVI